MRTAMDKVTGTPEPIKSQCGDVLHNPEPLVPNIPITLNDGIICTTGVWTNLGSSYVFSKCDVDLVTLYLLYGHLNLPFMGTLASTKASVFASQSVRLTTEGRARGNVVIAAPWNLESPGVATVCVSSI
jgi:hypothetical protein